MFYFGLKYLANKKSFAKIKLNTFRKIIFTIIFILLIFSPIEFYLRIKYRNFESNSYSYTISSFHPFLQSQLVKDDKLHTNSYGFRADEIFEKKPKGTYRVFVLGGSTVLSSDTDYENISTRVLEKLLRKKYPNKNIEVVNAGNDWYTTEHSLIQYLFKIRNFNPDLIIMWHGINDLYRSCSPQEFSNGFYKEDYSHFFGSVSNMVLKYFRPEPIISIKLLLYDFTAKFLKDNLYSDLFNYYNYKYPQQSIYAKGTIKKTYELNYLPSLDSFKRNIRSFIHATKYDNVQLILADQPYLYREDLREEELRRIFFSKLHCSVKNKYPSLKSMINSIKLFNRATKNLADQNDIYFLSLESRVPKNLNYFTDDVHYTQRGNILIANELFKYISSLGLIK